ncbi:hypothetical protein D0Y65_014029, partial [Glycine soja]
PDIEKGIYVIGAELSVPRQPLLMFIFFLSLTCVRSCWNLYMLPNLILSLTAINLHLHEPNLLSKVETSPVTLTQLTHQSPYPYQFSLFTHQFSRISSIIYRPYLLFQIGQLGY